MEEWKEVQGYDGYLVSNLGRVMNSKGYVFKLNMDSNGYYRVNLTKNGVLHTKRTHILVATAFIPNTNSKDFTIVDHIDRNKLNNVVENLRWTTQTFNCHNRKSKKNSTSRLLGVSFDKKSGKWRAEIQKHGERIVKTFDNERDAGLFYDMKAKQLYGEFARLNFKD